MRLALVACRSTPTNDALSLAPADGHAWEPMTRGWVVAELNGAVEFTSEHAPYGDVFAETTLALTREVEARREIRAVFASPTAA
jgi:hypothetical protein